MEHVYAVIMAGGGGTRLWPLSRREQPKQLLTLFGERSLFQLAVDRLEGLLPLEQIYVVTAAEQVDALAAQIPDLPRENFIVEPEGRGTAACIGLAAAHLQQCDPDAVMIVLTADHFIRRVELFQRALRAAVEVAGRGYLVTLGIEPTYPAMGYGYINRGDSLPLAEDLPIYEVREFKEKPDGEQAVEFFVAGTYYWNSGMFIWSAARIREEFARHMPTLSMALRDLDAAWGADGFADVLRARWALLEKTPIDRGVMEKAAQVAMIPVDLGWSDVGSWKAVAELYPPDAEGNISLGKHLPVSTTRTFVLAQGERLIATIGVKDLIIVDTPDALLVAAVDQTEKVRDVVAQLPVSYL